MKIAWHSAAPFAGTGYGQQTGLVTRELSQAGHDVAIMAYYGLKGSMMEWEGMPVYPGDISGYGGNMLPHYVRHFGGQPEDVQVITLQDVWTLNEHYERLRDLRVASWVPIDCAPLSPRVLQYFELTGATPIAMSRFGETMLQEKGLDPLYAPHMIDTSVFRPLPPAERADLRAKLGIEPDAFVVGMVANNTGTNPPRKAFPQVFQAFAELRREHPEAILYLHTDVNGADSGINLWALREFCGIPEEALRVSPQLQVYLGMPVEALRDLYNVFDVLANPSYGEGFGIPIVEAQACGCPVITSNWTSMPELTCAGWAVSGDPFYVPQYGSFWLHAFVIQVYEALELAYEARDDQELRARGVEFAQRYDIAQVMAEYWAPILERLDRPREVAPLNRAERRRRAKAAA